MLIYMIFIIYYGDYESHLRNILFIDAILIIDYLRRAGAAAGIFHFPFDSSTPALHNFLAAFSPRSHRPTTTTIVIFSTELPALSPPPLAEISTSRAAAQSSRASPAMMPTMPSRFMPHDASDFEHDARALTPRLPEEVRA